MCALAHETMKSTITFVTDGAKRGAIFQAAQRDVNGESEQAVKLKKLCDLSATLPCSVSATCCLPLCMHSRCSWRWPTSRRRPRHAARLTPCAALRSLLASRSPLQSSGKPAAAELQRPDNDIVYGMERASRAMAHLSELRSEGKFSEVWEVAAASA